MKQAGILSGLLLLGSLAPAAFSNDEGEDVAKRRGDPSPTAAASNIDEYTFQDEQVNLGPDDEDVLVLRSNQKNLLNRYVTKAFPLHHVTPREIRNVYRELTGKEGGRAEVIQDKLTGENYLQVIAPEWQLPYIEQTVAFMDQAWLQELNDGSVKHYYKAKYRDIRAVDRIAENWGGDGFTAFDDENNAATRRDEPYRVKSYLGGAELADIPEHQARFTVKIYEVNAASNLRMGLDFIAWKNGPGRNLFRFGAAGFDGDFFEDVSGGDGFSGHASANYLVTAAYLDFLSSKGKAKTLAAGVVQVRSGSVGSFGSLQPVVAFEARERERVFAGESSEHAEHFGDNSAGHFRDGRFRRELNYRATGEVGVSVNIAPVILEESMEVDIAVTVSNVEGYTPQGLPIINVSFTSTAARLADGGTLVLSGLTRVEKILSKQGVPFLSSIPGLGYLFGGENNTSRNKQVIVLLECQSETGGASRLANPPEVQTIADQVSGAAPVEIPDNAFGFDMWLFDSASGAEL